MHLIHLRREFRETFETFESSIDSIFGPLESLAIDCKWKREQRYANKIHSSCNDKRWTEGQTKLY